MKIKNKIFVILGIAFLAMLLLTANVNAADYTYTEKDITLTGTIDDLGLGGVMESPDGALRINEYQILTLSNVKQEVLNEYAKDAKSIFADIKMNLPTYITKVTDEEGNELEILEENGEKYVLLEHELKYTNTSSQTPLKEDIYNIKFFGNEERFYCFYEEDKQFTKNVQFMLRIYSENEPCNFTIGFYNKYGSIYEANSSWNCEYWWLADIWSHGKEYMNSDANCGREKYSSITYTPLPSNVNKSEIYFELQTEIYQGEEINIDGLGILYYARCSTPYHSSGSKYYVYKNSLDQLNKLDEPVQITLKCATGYEVICPIWLTYELDETVNEEIVTGTIDTKINHKDIEINIKGTGEAEFGTYEYNETDKIYEKLENMLNKTIENKYKTVRTEIFDVFREGGYIWDCDYEFQGPLQLTFDVGTEYNGKQYLIGHLENGLHYEEFTGKVEDGKITIEVESLSPFMISILEEKPVEETLGGEQPGEETPKGEQPGEETPKGEQPSGTGTGEEDTTKAPGKLPDTGIEVTIVFAIVMMVIAVVISYNKYKRLKDI